MMMLFELQQSSGENLELQWIHFTAEICQMDVCMKETHQHNVLVMVLSAF